MCSSTKDKHPTLEVEGAPIIDRVNTDLSVTEESRSYSDPKESTSLQKPRGPWRQKIDEISTQLHQPSFSTLAELVAHSPHLRKLLAYGVSLKSIERHEGAADLVGKLDLPSVTG